MDYYKIEFSRSAEKELRRINKSDIPKILEAIENLSEEPRPHGTVKLSGTDFSYRIRIGVYRVIYSIYDEVYLIGIEHIGHRKDVYK